MVYKVRKVHKVEPAVLKVFYFINLMNFINFMNSFPVRENEYRSRGFLAGVVLCGIVAYAFILISLPIR